MASTPNSIAAALTRTDEHLSLTVAGRTYEVVTMNGREKLSALFELELVCRQLATEAPPLSLLRAPATVLLHDGFGVYRPIHGIVVDAARTLEDDGEAELTLVVRPAVFELTLSRDSRVFIDMTVAQIVDRVMEKVSAKHRWEIGDRYRQRVYTAQYREDDWSFISRLLEEEGIYYWFDHGDEEATVVFADDSTAAPEIVGGAPIQFALDTGMLGKKELVHELAKEAHATATKFTVGSFDPWNPALKVMATEGDGIHELYDAPGGGPESPDVCRKQARVRLEHALSHRHTISGHGSSVRLEPGKIATILGHPVHDGRYFITETVHRVRQRRRFVESADGGYEVHFEGLSSERRFRPPETTPVPKQAGIQSGRVVGPPGEEIHTDARGRVRVQLHWDREGGWDDKAGKWLRVAQRGVASSLLLPRTGWNVLTFMEEGNVDAPTVLSRVHDAEHPPTYPLPANKTRTVFKTATSPGGGSHNEIRMEDLAGMQEMFLNASKDMNLIIQNMKNDNVGNDQERRIGNRQEVTIGERFTEQVMNDKSMKISGNEELEIETLRSKGVGGDEKVEIGGNRKIKAGSSFELVVEKDRKLEVSGSMIEKAKEGSIGVTSENAKIAIKGSAIHLMKGVFNQEVSQGAEVTIGGVCLEITGRNRTLDVSKDSQVTIHGSLLMVSNEDFTDGSDSVTQWTVKSSMTGSAPHVLVEAKSEIKLECGGTTIIVDKENVKITSPSYDQSAASDLIVSAPVINHN